MSVFGRTKMIWMWEKICLLEERNHTSILMKSKKTKSRLNPPVCSCWKPIFWIVVRGCLKNRDDKRKSQSSVAVRQTFRCLMVLACFVRSVNTKPETMLPGMLGLVWMGLTLNSVRLYLFLAGMDWSKWDPIHTSKKRMWLTEFQIRILRHYRRSKDGLISPWRKSTDEYWHVLSMHDFRLGSHCRLQCDQSSTKKGTPTSRLSTKIFSKSSFLFLFVILCFYLLVIIFPAHFTYATHEWI